MHEKKGYTMREKAYLVLQNGSVFVGKRFGAAGDAYGEAVFTTAMTGYAETLTDPTYHSQLVVQTFPLMGNVGIVKEDLESERPYLSGYIAREFCDEPSNFRCEETLENYLIRCGVPGIFGVDTRQITRILRDQGEMNGCILSRLPEDMDALLQKLRDLPAPGPLCGCTQAQSEENTCVRPVAVVDLGLKKSVLECLKKRGLPAAVVPADAKLDEVLALDPRGVLLFGGPGDPAKYEAAIELVRGLMQKSIPLFGIGLGNLVMACAMGAQTERMKFGHHGENQPVVDQRSGRLLITGQNHGYAVKPDSLPENVKPLYINANDKTIEGLYYPGRPAFSVQFQPEGRDAEFLFDDFARLIEGGEL